MEHHYSLSLFDLEHKKVCDLYDSHTEAEGQAFQIYVEEELSGWKQVTFTLPYYVDGKENFRWKYIKNEYLLRYRKDDYTDYFIVQAPKKSKNGKAVTNVVKCGHTSASLKTKNLALVMDGDNGIGTIQELMNVVLAGTGWSLGECDNFYERDGITDKRRSLKSDSKRGTYALITDICNLFNAYPIYHDDGEHKTVDIHALSNKLPLRELFVGKNLTAFGVEGDTSNLVTRLYVEGEYGDFGYVGIDSVNPTGFNYLLDFSYYEQAGLFTATHQAALEAYETDMKAAIDGIKSKAATILAYEDELNSLWGQINYVVYVLDNGAVSRVIKGGTVLDGQEVIGNDDKLIVLPATGNYREVVGPGHFEATDTYAIKFLTLPSGGIGARQVSVESKEKMIDTYTAEIETASGQKKTWLLAQIAKYEDDIDILYDGTVDEETGEETYVGLYSAMRTAIELVAVIDQLYTDVVDLQQDQRDIEDTFVEAMGEMLKDGYWSNTNYAPGQEEWLYSDALDRMAEIAKPAYKYTITFIRPPEGETPLLNAEIRLYDKEMNVNDEAYVSKRTTWVDVRDKDTIDISNQTLRSADVTFDVVLSKITELSDLVDQRNALYERAKVINNLGQLPIENVTGELNLAENGFSSPTSNWYSDEDGGLVFESILQDSAYKIGGTGFMISNEKDENGNWTWRIVGDGDGFLADAITDGYLDSNRIEDDTITIAKLSNDVGAQLDLELNPLTLGIGLTVGQIDLSAQGAGDGHGNPPVIKGSGFSIGPDGIEISSLGTIAINGGSLEINSAGNFQINAGGTFTVTGGNFGIDASGNVTVKGAVTASRGKIGGWDIEVDNLHSGSGTSYVALDSSIGDYAIWAGNETPGSANFAVKKDGTVYLKKLIAKDDQDHETTVNLTNYQFWKLNYSVITSSSADSITLSNGTTINFKTAASFGLFGEWSNGAFVVDMKDAIGGSTVYHSESSGRITSTMTNAQIKSALESSTSHSVSVDVEDSSYGETLVTLVIDASGVYKAGWDAAKAAIAINGNVIVGPSSTVGTTETLYTVTAGASKVSQSIYWAAQNTARFAYQGIALINNTAVDWKNATQTNTMPT